MGLDERLRADLSHVSPSDPSGAYERVLEKKIRRRVLRKVWASALVIGVVAGTGLGFYGLTRTFASNGPTPPPAGSTSPTEIEPSQEPTPTGVGSGRDIGLAFRVCDVTTKRSLDLLGDGTNGTAWMGTKATEQGTCSKDADITRHIVAVDVTGDGVADAWTEGPKYCVSCRPFGGIDLDADGTQELVVLAQEASTPQFVLYAVRGAGGAEVLAPILVARPGNPRGGFPGGKPVSIWTGGDEGFTSVCKCEGFPGQPVLVAASADHPVEGAGSDTYQIHITRMRLEEDGELHVLDAVDTTQPTSDPLPDVFASVGHSCGLDLNDLP